MNQFSECAVAALAGQRGAERHPALAAERAAGGLRGGVLPGRCVHRVGVLTFAGLLLLPALNFFAPGWGIAVPTRESARQVLPVVVPETGRWADAPGAPSEPAVAVDMKLNVLPPAASASLSSWAGQHLPPLMFLVWVAGVVVVLARTLSGFRAVRQLQRVRSHRLTEGHIVEQARQLAEELEIRPPGGRLRLADDSAVVMPMTWGWWAPTVLLPRRLPSSGSRERLRSVLLHEMAHIRRGDWAAQCLATAACALYWFHPLVWRAAARLKADAERATDEQVVVAGVKASDYCGHLLELARVASGRGQAMRYARYGVPMTRRGGMEERLHALLDTQQGRGLSRLSVRVVTGGFGLACLLLATLQFRGRADAPDAQVAQDPEERGALHGQCARWRQGVLVGDFLSSLAQPGVVEAQWGAAANEMLFVNTGSSSSGGPGYKTREFVAELQDAPPGASWRWETEPGTNWAGASARFGGKPASDASNAGLMGLSASIPQELSQLTVKVGVANGPWTTAIENPVHNLSSDGNGGYIISFARGTEDNGNASVTVVHTVFDQDVRVTAVDTAGREHTSPASSSVGNDAFYQVTATFEGLPLRRVRAFRLQIRPYHWVTFPNVVLEPQARLKRL